MQIQDIPRTYVKTTLRALRLPVDLSESIARRNGGDRPWPPSVVANALEGQIKKTVGSLIRDVRLVEEGELEQAAAKEQRQALLLGAVAEARRERAEERFEERVEQIDEARQATLARAEAEKKAAARAAASKRKNLAGKAQKLAETDARLEAAAEESLERRDRSSRAGQIAQERQAVAEERKAVATEAAVAELDAKIEASRQARKAD